MLVNYIPMIHSDVSGLKLKAPSPDDFDGTQELRALRKSVQFYSSFYQTIYPKHSVLTHPRSVITYLRYSVLTYPRYSVLTYPKYSVFTQPKYSLLASTNSLQRLRANPNPSTPC